MEATAEHPLAAPCAALLRDAFAAYNAEFRALTRRARARFEQRDWEGGKRDAVERIELYDHCVHRAIRDVEQLLGRDLHDRGLWRGAKRVFADLVAGVADTEFT